jgi:hypothetical protein
MIQKSINHPITKNINYHSFLSGQVLEPVRGLSSEEKNKAFLSETRQILQA